VKFEVFTAMTVKNAAFWDIKPQFVATSPIFFTLLMEAISFSYTSVLTRATRRHVTDDGILHSHRHENVRSYILASFFSGAINRQMVILN
jgi:hypothetical protein